MRTHDTDDHDDIRTLIERGSSTWAGPSPSARQARWAAEERPRRWMSFGMAVAGFGIAALLAGSLALVATSQSPNDAAASVVRLVSHVFTTPPTTPAVSLPPSPPASAAPGLAGGPTPSGAPRPARTPTPRYVPGTHRPTAPGGSPQPSPTGPPGPTPFPSPSPTDE
jgi:hypothetical protein